FDLNRAPDSPNQFHCFHCKDVLRDGESCKLCTCAKCGSGLGKGLCYICGHNQNSLNDSPSISETSSQSPPNINHCCYECGDPLDGIFCKRCTCNSCGKDAHIDYNCPSKVSVISNPEPCNNQTIDELPQSLTIFHRTFQSEAESPFTLDSTLTYVDEFPNASPPDYELVSSEVIEIVIPKEGRIDDDILLTIKDDILREKLLNVNLFIFKIKALNANPTPSSGCKTKYPSTSLNSLLEKTNIFDNSLPELETFCFDVEEISNGSTTTPPDLSLLEYEVFYDDHVKETVVAVPLLILILLFMLRSSLIFRSTHFLLPI
nr:hypothetical protein [Tanacetum cinerariifolium]